ncbi:TetR family transcriptional regulator [Streptomyces abyssalis]|uniref:TetR family transcriptional regulator n=1 Tax=Streptomyces abyssalis TaxID=933944 RepID=A0A1E7JJM9_9ACTN|nr:TetR family transcriptional regulator [Streptomyces abyssalis]OEU87317.1 TetR family transcriptional regulator [Streptomyces abyssalis]OEU87848.1 TetR family transcriptional regulator [Streptomyces abyssalis]OEV28427.1 TetR family transcriptional regulator [Streptomyces nanshensis]
MTPTSAERGQETRRRLLDAAAQLIVEDGWGAVTTRRVADRAELRPGLVHYHFSTVTDLLIEAALASARREMTRAAEAMSQADDASGGVIQVLEMVSEYTATDPTTVLFSEMLLASTRLERLRTELAELMAEWRGGVAEWLRAAGGTSGSQDDAEATALLLGAAIDGLVLHRLIDPSLARISVSGPLARLARVAPAG